MNQSVDNQQRATSTTQEAFKDFNPPPTTDGSYKGTMKHKQATQNHLESKFDEEFKRVNARLKEAKTRVSITRKGNSLQLQATLPPKPDSDKVTSYQQLISLGIPANLEGLQTAYEEANELGRLLARKQFEWNEKYLGKPIHQVDALTIEHLLNNLESQYYKSRKKTIKSEHTFYGVSCGLNNILLPHKEKNASFEVFQGIIDDIPVSIKKDASIKHLNLLSNCYELGYKFKRLSRKDVQPKHRDIPKDAEIMENFKLFQQRSLKHKARLKEHQNNWLFWRWCYGMLATYGLRPRELFVKPDIDWWLSSENINNSWKVHELNKTGYRSALALNQDWIELFDLKNSKCLEVLRKMTIDTNPVSLKKYVTAVAYWFKTVEIGFQPYDLRHAWAIRAHLIGIPIKIAADNLGHSVNMHTETYQKYMGEENRKIAIYAAVSKKSEIDVLRDENIQLKLEIERLKIENERYRLGVNSSDIFR